MAQKGGLNRMQNARSQEGSGRFVSCHLSASQRALRLKGASPRATLAKRSPEACVRAGERHNPFHRARLATGTWMESDFALSDPCRRSFLPNPPCSGKNYSCGSRSCAIWTAFKAAPLRIWSITHQKARPCSTVGSLRKRPTCTSSVPASRPGIG